MQKSPNTVREVLPFPEIPNRLLSGRDLIEPCPELTEWIGQMFLTPEQCYYNADHEHLADLRYECLWTNLEYNKSGQRIIGTAELADKGGNPWAAQRWHQQVESWYGYVPDFILTFDAIWLSEAEPVQICALVEHELYHCYFALDKYGNPKLDKYGGLKPALRPHDVEEFVGVVRRYGLVTSDAHKEMAEAIIAGPTIAAHELRGMCGVCQTQN